VAASERLYVLAIDAAQNRVVVGAADELEAREADVDSLRFPCGAPEAPLRATVRVRHRAPEVPATVYFEGERGHVVFDRPVRSVAPGQSCVFYDGDVVVGDGVLRRDSRFKIPNSKLVGELQL
jgi:tRNA-uridine 2-sulfurtransferase